MITGAKELYKDSDWSLETIKELKPRGLYARTAASQDVIDRCSCFYIAPFCAIVDCFSPARLKELYPDYREKIKTAMKEGWDKLVADGKFTPGSGGAFVDGVDYSRNAWNAAFPELKVSSYRTGILSDKFNLAVGLYWAPIIGIYANESSYADIVSDDSLDNAPTGDRYGHCVRYGKDMIIMSRKEVIDNYPKSLGKYNEYSIDLERYSGAGGTMSSAYFFFPQ